MEKNYDKYLATLHIYSPKMTERHRLVLRVARIFGECELDMPPDFESRDQPLHREMEIVWPAQRCHHHGPAEWIHRRRFLVSLLARGLPPQFFYLALQESNFNPYAVGPHTRMGFAKGMWQFIPQTAVKYSLHLGPLVDQPRPDPADERHNTGKKPKQPLSIFKTSMARMHRLQDFW